MKKTSTQVLQSFEASAKRDASTGKQQLLAKTDDSEEEPTQGGGTTKSIGAVRLKSNLKRGAPVYHLIDYRSCPRESYRHITYPKGSK